MLTSLSEDRNLVQPELTEPQTLLNTLQRLRQIVIYEGEEIVSQWQSSLERQAFVNSALNLAYYLALRKHDLRQLQIALMPWGLSSLGRIEARVLPNLNAAIATLGAVCHQDPNFLPHRPPLEAFFEGDRLLKQHTEEVFGKLPDHRRVRIMVTLPTEAADNYEFVRELIQRGTDCIRINCAHDTSDHWSAMIEHLRRAEAEIGRACKVFMDLGGPKPRLGKVLLPIDKQRLHQGDRLQLTRDLPKIPVQNTFQANCTIPEILSQLEVGTRVWIDDGKIGTQVESLLPEGVLLRITHARPKGEKLRPDKGINFPDSLLNLSPLTSKDRQDLDFVAAHADMIGYSFVQKATDIELLQLELQARLGATWRTPAIIAKIETRSSVEKNTTTSSFALLVRLTLPFLSLSASGSQS